MARAVAGPQSLEERSNVRNGEVALPESARQSCSAPTSPRSHRCAMKCLRAGAALISRARRRRQRVAASGGTKDGQGR